MSSKTVYLAGTEIILTSPFIREEVNALKRPSASQVGPHPRSLANPVDLP